MILDNATGDAYVYGRYKFTPASDENVNARIKVEYGDEEGKTAYSPEASAAEDIKTMILAVWPFIRIEAAEAQQPAQPRSKLSKVPNSAWNRGEFSYIPGNTYLVAGRCGVFIAAADRVGYG